MREDTLDVYFPSVEFFNQPGLPQILDPYVCKYTQPPSLQWLQQIYVQFLSQNDPYIASERPLIAAKVDGTLTGSFPPKELYAKSKSMSVKEIAAMSYWLIWTNFPT